MTPDRDVLSDQGVRRPDHWTAVENFASHARGVFKPGEYRAKHLKHEPGVYEMTDLVPAAERDRLWAESERLRGALTKIERLKAKWDAPLTHPVGDMNDPAYAGAAAWAAVGSEAHKIAETALRSDEGQAHRCARDSDWCDGVICKERGMKCPNADEDGT